MMKILLSLLPVLFFCTNCFSQKKQNVYFLKNNQTKVSIKDSADFIRVIQEPDSGSVNFKILEFYKNGSKKLIGEVSSFDPKIIYEGSILSFDSKGKKVSLINYLKGDPINSAYYYYPNGKLKKLIEYGTSGMEEFVSYNKYYHYKMIAYFDSLGVQNVNHGNGYCIEVDPKDKTFEEGLYKDGLRDSIWKGVSDTSHSVFEEIYKEGKLISGVLTKTNGQVFTYSKVFILPAYKGGVAAFSRYLANHIKYPMDAFNGNISGYVHLSFVVEKDGTLTDFKVLQHVWPSMDAEALRVLKGSRDWEAGKYRGVPVRVVFIQPIAFKL